MNKLTNHGFRNQPHLYSLNSKQLLLFDLFLLLTVFQVVFPYVAFEEKQKFEKFINASLSTGL